MDTSGDDTLLPIMQNPDSSARTDPGEMQAVYDIMMATGNTWVTAIPDVCTGRWHGIECTLDKNSNLMHVVSLSFGVLSDDTAFPSCTPNSTISPSVSKLVHLRRLFFYKCCTGHPQPIPGELGKLGNRLEYLVLRENGHVGDIPVGIANLSKLHTLDLHGNGLSGAIPDALGGMESLQRLDLSSNRLDGSIPRKLGGLRNAIILDLSDNRLEGDVPQELGKLEHLKKLDISRNRLNGSIPDELGEFPHILFMDMSDNKLTGGIPQSFGRLNSLQNLILRNNELRCKIPESLGNLTDLQVLVLSSSNIVGRIPKALGNLNSLKVLHLQNNKLNGTIPAEVLNLPRLSELNLALNSLSGQVNVSREAVSRLGNRLRLVNNSNLCYKSSEHEQLLGIDECEEDEDYRDPAQISLPAIIVPSEPSILPFNSGFAGKTSVSVTIAMLILVLC